MGLYNRKIMKNYINELIFFKLEQLREYYNEKGLTIVGLNDAQGFNTKTLFRKNLLEYISMLLKCEDNSATVINAFSSVFNKTEHIDYFLESNLSVEEIKDLQIEEKVSICENLMNDFHLPKFIGKIGYINKVLYRKEKEDKDIFLTDSIRCAKEPIIIYSCGANDLMCEVSNKSLGIKKDYIDKENNEDYNFILKKFEDSGVVKKVIGNVERNFNNILALNNDSDIFVLGLHIPEYIQCKDMEVFSFVLSEYNRQLEKLCKKYGTQYIDIASKSHGFSVDCYILAESIIEEIFLRKFGIENEINKPNIQKGLKVYNHGTMDILINLKHDLIKQKNKIESTPDCEVEIYNEKIQEIERQKKIVEKVILKRM